MKNIKFLLLLLFLTLLMGCYRYDATVIMVDNQEPTISVRFLMPDMDMGYVDIPSNICTEEQWESIDTDMSLQEISSIINLDNFTKIDPYKIEYFNDGVSGVQYRYEIGNSYLALNFDGSSCVGKERAGSFEDESSGGSQSGVIDNEEIARMKSIGINFQDSVTETIDGTEYKGFIVSGTISNIKRAIPADNSYGDNIFDYVLPFIDNAKIEDNTLEIIVNNFEIPAVPSYFGTETGTDGEMIYPYLSFEFNVSGTLKRNDGVTVKNGKAVVEINDKFTPVHLIWEVSSAFVANNAKYLSDTTPTPPKTGTAYPTPSTVLVNGTEISFEAYLIDESNYFKLRDIAMAISGTNKQFDVGYNDTTRAITLTTGKPYTTTGGELTVGDGSVKTYITNEMILYKDGQRIEMTSYLIAGSNFLKLRDVMRLFDIGVTYDEVTRNIGIDTNVGYVE